MVYSADGKHLYIVDGSNILRKLRSDDLWEETVLELTAPVEKLTYSKVGLVIPLQSENAVWVIDSDTLEVCAEITVPGRTVRRRQPNHSHRIRLLDTTHRTTLPLRHCSVDGEFGDPASNSRIARVTATFLSWQDAISR